MQRVKFRLLMTAFMAIPLLSPMALPAQISSANSQDGFRDLSTLKPPAGSKVAIVVFEDLGCPACAYAHPIELDAAKRANVSLLRYDFPIAGHIWTFQGAVCARYIQDKVSPRLADEFRSDVFAAQTAIANKDDLARFTQLWLQRHNQKMPFVIDPDGSLAKEVQADFDLGRHINVTHTPTILVVTKDQRQIVCGTETLKDPSRILPAVEAALGSTHTPDAKTRSTSTR